MDDSKSIEICIDTLDKHYKEKYSLLNRRVDFYKYVQRSGADFTTFSNKTKALWTEAGLDKFSTEDQLVVRLVVGLMDRNLQKEVLKMSNPTLKDIREKCLSWEAAGIKQDLLDCKPKILQTQAKDIPKGVRVLKKVWSKSCKQVMSS
ncbi:unnamed protein product [Lepeophtheirus salmonis]|uniref:(salmon louse) hypothetical protein n=1 Tax=Lepeophtheirus salmonis TaxID=72036 RepID=A0A7R8D6X1_LEPSM|nr:unnamed protein product [Lepeophtheirus salmonis]CAF3021930.1 unnamed protein product [Lepeophtheirus salmonis]